MSLTVTTVPEFALIGGELTPRALIAPEHLRVPDACAGHELTLRGVCDQPGCRGEHCNDPAQHACGGCGGFYRAEHLDERTGYACPDCLAAAGGNPLAL